MISHSFRDLRASYFNMKMRLFEELIYLEDASLECRSMERSRGEKDESLVLLRDNFIGKVLLRVVNSSIKKYVAFK